MEALAREFVRRREVLRGEGGGFRVPEDLRRLAVRFGRWAVANGESLGGAATQLGVSRVTLERWLERRQPLVAAPALREVVLRESVVAESPVAAGSLIVVTPDGFRIEGLCRADLSALVPSLR